MSIKFAISTISIAAILTFTQSAIASAEAFKTDKGHVVMTGFQPSQRYPIGFVTMEGKSGKRADKVASSCGNIIVEKAEHYKTLTIGTETIDPSTLAVKEYISIKEYNKCKPKQRAKTKSPGGVAPAVMPQGN